MRPFNVWFRHPVHVRDYDGALDDWEPMTAARAGGKATGGKAKLQKLGNIAVMERAADEMRRDEKRRPSRYRFATWYGAAVALTTLCGRT